MSITAPIEQVSQLQSRVWVRGSALSLEEMLNLIKEDVIGETGVEFLGSDKDIIERVLHQNDEDRSDEDNDDEDNLPVEIMKPSEALEICTQMERVCLEYTIPSVPFTINLQTQVRKLQGHIHCLNDQSCVQSLLDQFFAKPTSKDFICLKYYIQFPQVCFVITQS